MSINKLTSTIVLILALKKYIMIAFTVLNWHSKITNEITTTITKKSKLVIVKNDVFYVHFVNVLSRLVSRKSPLWSWDFSITP